MRPECKAAWEKTSLNWQDWNMERMGQGKRRRRRKNNPGGGRLRNRENDRERQTESECQGTFNLLKSG